MAKKVRTETQLEALPVGSKIQFRGKHLWFRYSKQENGLWKEPPRVIGVSDVKTSAELAGSIDRVTFHGSASVW